MVDNEFLQLAKDSGVIYCPTLVVISGYSIAYKSLKEGFSLNDPNKVIDPIHETCCLQQKLSLTISANTKNLRR